MGEFFVSVFLGEWKNGLKHGKGVENTAEGRYEGEWKDGMVNLYVQAEQCKCTFSNISCFGKKKFSFAKISFSLP